MDLEIALTYKHLDTKVISVIEIYMYRELHGF